MRIIVNSDVLHTSRLFSSGLPSHIADFCREAATSGGILVIPKTVALESARHQDALYKEAVAKLEEAKATLERWGIVVPVFLPDQVVRTADILTVLEQTGIRAEVEDPTLDDYRDAERRACLHLPPQPPNAKTDEMRDLVIWAVALRVAKRDGKAIILSRDVVHSHDRGYQEASEAGLLRARTFDEALELLGRTSKAIVLARSVLGTVWRSLREGGLPLPDEIPMRRFSNLQFRRDTLGYIEMRSMFEFTGPVGRISGNAHIYSPKSMEIAAELTSLRLNGVLWKQGDLRIVVQGELPRHDIAADELLQELQSAIEGES